jgi:asparagine synthetase B (glutamine-hydrolysing)
MKNKFLLEISLETFLIEKQILPTRNLVKCIENENKSLFIIGSYLSKIDDTLIKPILTSSNRDTFYDDLKGDFLMVFINKKEKYIDFVNDKNGKYKGYFSICNNRLLVSNHFFSHLLAQKKPTFSNRGLFQMLNANYLCDPDTLSEEIKVLPIGCYVRVVNSSKYDIERYYNPIDFEVELYKDTAACVAGLDSALSNLFRDRYQDAQSEPIVMLSGGIDSLIMMDYLEKELQSTVKSITFAVKDVPNDDLKAAKLAAQYYKSNHFEIQIDPANTWENLFQGMRDNNSFTYASIINSAINKSLKENGITDTTLLTGQDSRLPSPSFDMGNFLGLKRNFLNESPSLNEEMLWVGANLFKGWGGKGKELIQAYLKKGKKHNTQEEYFDMLLSGGLHYRTDAPKKFDRTDFYNSDFTFANFDTSLNVFKSVVNYCFIGQCTDNMNEYTNSLEAQSYRVDFPFFDAEFMKAANAIPIEIASKPIYTFKTGSKVPIARKFLLRKLVNENLPKELLWRRKDTPFTANLLFTSAFLERAKKAISQYKDALLGNLEINEINNARIQDLIDQIQAHDTTKQITLKLGVKIIRILYLIIINEIMINNNINIINELEKN